MPGTSPLDRERDSRRLPRRRFSALGIRLPIRSAPAPTPHPNDPQWYGDMVLHPTVPRVTLIVRPTTHRSIDDARVASSRARLDGVAVALSTRHLLPGPWHPHDPTTVDSLWLPETPGHVLPTWQGRRLIESTTAYTTPRLIVPWALTSGRGAGRKGTVGLVSALNRTMRAGRITLAIRPDHRHPIREQLMAMSALRRLAEEWDYDLAVDLAGTRDGPWEAEAALHRLMPRLTTIRLGPLSGLALSGATDPRLASRVLSAARDVAFTGTFVVASGGGPRLLRGDRYDAAEALAQMIRDRFAPERGPWPPSRSTEPSRWVV